MGYSTCCGLYGETPPKRGVFFLHLQYTKGVGKFVVLIRAIKIHLLKEVTA